MHVCGSAVRTGLLIFGLLAVRSAELVKMAYFVERHHLEHVVRVHYDLRAGGHVDSICMCIYSTSK